MKICWDNLEKLRFIPKSGYFKQVFCDGSRSNYTEATCAYCGESCLVAVSSNKTKYKLSFCDQKCQGNFRTLPEEDGYINTAKTKGARHHGSIRHRARRQGTLFNLSQSWFIERYEKGICELTGFPFSRHGSGMNIYSPSIDRIDPGKGYTEDNCRMVIHCVNNFKFNGTDSEMYHIAEKLLENKEISSADK